MGVYARTVKGRTGVHPNTKCYRCGITAAKASRLPPTPTGINHPDYYQSLSFYQSGGCNTGVPVTHMCAKCHRETQLEGAMKAMNAYAKRHGEKALAERMLRKP